MRARSAVFAVLLFLSVVSFLHIVEFNRPVVVDRLSFGDQDIKVILSWNPFFADPFYGFGHGEKAFERHGCEHANCRITANKHELPQHEFDAIVFHGFEFYELFYGKPLHRSARQYYVFMSLESARRAAIPPRMRHFYNLTMTYRLDSDITWTYFRVRNSRGDVIAPLRAPMAWNNPDFKNLPETIKTKTRKVAWFVSNCRSTNGREEYVVELKKYIDVDIFGACGDLQCPSHEHPDCSRMLREDYYFYLAFENSHCKDYITEKVLTALNSNTIPIFYGNVDLSNFLPPHSYIDASKLSPEELAVMLDDLIEDPAKYARYFWWQSEYSFEKSMPSDEFPKGSHPMCSLCRSLNERSHLGQRDLFAWWMGSDNEPACLR